MQIQIPNWIKIVSGLISALALFVGLSLYISPSTFIPEIDFSIKGASFLVSMWAARQISIAVIIAYSLLKKSLPMLKISLIAYNLMNLQDVFIGVANNDKSLVIGGFIFFLLSASMIFSLIQKEERR